MQYHDKVSRKVICSINSSKFHTEDKGKLNIHFEIVGKDIVEINSQDFCSTRQAFVINSFNALQDKFSGRIFMAEIEESEHEIKDGDCHYILRSQQNCSELRGFNIAEIIYSPLPSPDSAVITMQKAPIARTLFLKDGNNLYGPFEYKKIDSENSNEEQYLLTPSSASNLFISKRNQKSNIITKLPALEAEPFTSTYEDRFNTLDNRYLFAVTKNTVLECKNEIIDFISEEKIVKSVGELVCTRPGKRWATNTELQNLQREVKANSEYNNNQERFDKFFDILKDLSKWDVERSKLITLYFSSEEGKSAIHEYISQNKELYFSDLKSKLEERLQYECQDKKDELSAYKEQLNDNQALLYDVKKELLSTQSNIDKLRKENNDVGDLKISKEAQKIIEDKKSSLSNELDAIIEELLIKKRELSKYKDVQAIEEKLALLEDEYNTTLSMKTKLEGKIKNGTSELLAEMAILKPQLDVLFGGSTLNTEPLINYISPVEKNDITAQEYIKSIENSMNEQGREADQNQIANLLITIAQNQFTLFSGKPGTGKTSTAQMLGDAMGLGNRLLTIPVAKGWTSTRDVLGFYNTLSQTYQSSSSGLYELLDQINEEVSGKPAIVLLDEFNLSQPEHYLSNFLEISDEGSKREIKMGAPGNSVRVPSYLRFIGTLNSDETVQTLSPRMLDRAAVITFDQYPSIDALLSAKSEVDSKPVNMITGDQFVSMFTTDKVTLSANYKHIINVCIAALTTSEYGTPILLSMRKIKTISQYCNVADSIMSSATGDVVMDYALSQHLLPVLSGHGELHGKRLEHLLNTLTGLSEDFAMTIEKLQRIIEIGKINFDTYTLLV